MLAPTSHARATLCTCPAAPIDEEMFLSRFMGLQGGGRRTPDESGAKLTEAGLPLGFSLKQGYRPYMEDVYVAKKFQEAKDSGSVSVILARRSFAASAACFYDPPTISFLFSPPVSSVFLMGTPAAARASSLATISHATCRRNWRPHPNLKRRCAEHF